MKKLISLLIVATIPILIGLLYAIFEDDILRLLASLPQNTNQKIIVRAAFLSVSLVILGLSYFLLEFRSKYIAEKKKSESPTIISNSAQRILKSLRNKSSDLEQKVEKIESKLPVIDIKRGKFFEDE